MAPATDDADERQEAVRVASRRRETDMLWTGHHDAHVSHDVIHGLQHAHEVELARQEEKRLAEGMVAHAKEHAANREAIDKALASVDKLAVIHSEAHQREHANHEIRHKDGAEAIAKAEASMDKRLGSLNEFREQLREQAKLFASTERVDGIQSAIDQRLGVVQSAIDRRFADTTKHTDERYEENRRRIEALEKGDVKQEGRSLGQGAVVAIIIGAIGAVGGVLSIIIVIANFATRGAP